MTENKKTKSKPASKYKQLTAQMIFTDGMIETVTFYHLNDCFDYLQKSLIKRDYINSVRIELF